MFNKLYIILESMRRVTFGVLIWVQGGVIRDGDFITINKKERFFEIEGMDFL